MKTNKFWSILMMLALALSASISFSSCSGDDEDDNGGGQASGSNTGKAPQGAKAIDLGLSVKWANMNIGATSMEDYGDYFAWGERTPKSKYDWSTYKWCFHPDADDDWEDNMTKYCTSSSFGTADNKTVLELADDAAHANWGGSWRMPTIAEQNELRATCTWTWISQKGVNGYKVTSKTNGNSIFLPAASYFDDEGEVVRYYLGKNGYYWSSCLDRYEHYQAYILYWNEVPEWVHSGTSRRSHGQSVRAVCP